MNALQPEVGQWYRHLDKGEAFAVIDIDDDAGTIDVQSLYGDLDEIDRYSWGVMALARTEPPEDWTGPVDDVERDDLGYSDVGAEPPSLMQPPAPFGIEEWDDTRSGAIDVDEDEPAPGALVAHDR